MVFLCFFNYLDTITDIGTTLDMFRNGKTLLGTLSLLTILLVGTLAPQLLRSLEKGSYKRTWSCSEVLSILTLTSTQNFVWKHFLRHPKKNYDRRNCPRYDNFKCRTSDCDNLKHKLNQLYKGIIFEKMVENQLQLIIQIVNIAPDYFSSTCTVQWKFWDFWKLVSIVITLISLARSCVIYESRRHELISRRFSFYSIGKGFLEIHPQKWIIFLVHSTAIAGKVLAVIFLIALMNHDFSAEVNTKVCFLSTALKAIQSRSNTNCKFEDKVAWLLFLYAVAWYLAVSLIPLLSFVFILRRDILKTLAKRVFSLCVSILYFAFWSFPFGFVFRQRHFMFSWTNSYPKVNLLMFGIKILPSFVGTIGNVTFVLLFYFKGDESFTNVNLGITPFNLSLISIGNDVVHLMSLVYLVYRADPQYTKALSNEKILDILIRMKKIDDSIDVSCSRTAEDVIREAIEKDDNFSVYVSTIRMEMLKLQSALLPALLKEANAMDKINRNAYIAMQQAILECGGENGYENPGYRSLVSRILY